MSGLQLTATRCHDDRGRSRFPVDAVDGELHEISSASGGSIATAANRLILASEEELQGHLDYSRAYVGLDLSERWRFNVADRQPEVGMVQQVEQFTTELKLF